MHEGVRHCASRPIQDSATPRRASGRVDAAHNSPPALARSSAQPGESHELAEQALHVNSLMARHGGRVRSTENAADIGDSGWLCEAVIALAGMLFTAWALGYLWWHIDQLLDDDGVDNDDMGIRQTEPWYFAWVS